MQQNLYKIVTLSIVFALFGCGEKNSQSNEVKNQSKEIIDDLRKMWKKEGFKREGGTIDDG